jgi:hypothetical protein
VRSLSEDRHRLARDVWRYWKHLEDGEADNERSPSQIEHRKAAALAKLRELCEPEIVEAVLENFVGCVLCAVGFSVEDGEVRDISYPAVVASAGVRRAAETITKIGGNRPLHEHVKACAAEVFEELRVEAREEWRKLAPEEILTHVVSWSRPAAAVLLANLTFKQREALLLLLIAQTPKQSVYISLGEEPEDELLWRIWCTAVLLADHAAIKEILEKTGRPTIVLLGEGWGKPLPKGKSAAAPLHASYYLQLAQELRKRGYPVKRPESRRRPARLTGKSRSTIDRYLACGAHAELLRVIGNRATVGLTLEGIKRSIDAARGEKRGPKNDT